MQMKKARDVKAIVIAIVIAFAMAVIMPFSGVKAEGDSNVITLTQKDFDDAKNDESDVMSFENYGGKDRYFLNPGSYILGEDINIGKNDGGVVNNLLIFSGGTFDIDLGGHTIGDNIYVDIFTEEHEEESTTVTISGEGTVINTLYASNASVTINGCSFLSRLWFDCCDVTINDVDIEVDGDFYKKIEWSEDLISQLPALSFYSDDNNVLEINGGSFKGKRTGLYVGYGGGTVIINDGIFSGQESGLFSEFYNGKIVLSGGSFMAEGSGEDKDYSGLKFLCEEEDKLVFDNVLAEGYKYYYTDSENMLIESKINGEIDDSYGFHIFSNKTSLQVVKAENTVSFETDGGSEIAAQTVDYGSKATKPDDPTKPGYKFVDWYTDISYETKFDFSKAITEDWTLYAKWEQIASEDNKQGSEKDPSDESKKDVTPEVDYNDNSDSGSDNTTDNSSGGSSEGSKKETYSNEWVKGKWYDSDGGQTYAFEGHWEENNIGWWYIDEAGWYPKDQWQKIDGYWYYFNSIGYACINQYAGSWDSGSGALWWVNEKGQWDGSAPGYWGYTDGWFFYKTDGWYAQNEWLIISEIWYQFDAEGWLSDSTPR